MATPHATPDNPVAYVRPIIIPPSSSSAVRPDSRGVVPLQAIKAYLKMGFRPSHVDESHPARWKALEKLFESGEVAPNVAPGWSEQPKL